jgi:hypothetical protein
LWFLGDGRLLCVQVFMPGSVDYVALVSRVAAFLLSGLYVCLSFVDAGPILKVSGKLRERGFTPGQATPA